MKRNMRRNAALFQLHRYRFSSLSSSHFEDQQPQLLIPSNAHHVNALKTGSINQTHVSNYILNLYVKSHDLFHARKLFDEIPDRDVRSWTILISGFSRIGSHELALNLFTHMQNEGICPNHYTISIALKCCSSLCEVRMGKAVHGWTMRNGIVLDVMLENSMLDFYVKCGDLCCGKALFELVMSCKDTVSWNIMMSGYIQIGDMENALDLFRRFPVKDVASWNTIMDGCVRNDYETVAVKLLYEMVESGVAFSQVTFTVALVLVATLNILELGRQIHGRTVRFGVYSDGFVRNSLIDMYCKCGQMEKASFIFEKLDCKISRYDLLTESVSWSSMVAGYVQNGRLEDALRLFSTMVHERIEVDKFTITSIVSACANAGHLELGQLMHCHIFKIGHKPDAHMGSSLIDMYAKCGRVDDAWSVFGQTNVRNIVLWTSMISSYAFHGKGREAIWLFEYMRDEGIKPNEISFVGVLNACSHAGLVTEGCNYFGLMKEVYDIKPQVEHFTCMVDLFGRAGRLDEITDFIYKNDISHLSAVWGAFLSSCQVHKNIEMARWVSGKLLELEPSSARPYLLLSNTCATDHRWDEAAKLRGLMQERGVKKHPGQSWI